MKSSKTIMTVFEMPLIAIALVLFTCSASVSATVNVEWVVVGDAGNPDDTHGEGFGGVSYDYQIGRYEVTNAQYGEFLNAVAAVEDTYELYNDNMAGGYLDTGGIIRSGTAGNYSYEVRTGRENKPVNYVNWYDCLRFCNWLNNDRPTGLQDARTTEDGAYKFTGPTSAGSRNANAKVFLASEDEWYKSAYYKGGATDAGYWDYAVQSDTAVTAEAPPAGAYGTYDQNGNLWEWNEELVGESYRGLRGGDGSGKSDDLTASFRDSAEPRSHGHNVGFRVARIFEPINIGKGIITTETYQQWLAGAELEEPGYSLMIQQSPPDAGTVLPHVGIQKVEVDQIVTLKAIPRPGYRFVCWLGDVSEFTSNETTVLIDAPKLIIAVYGRSEYAFLTMDKSITRGPGMGGLYANRVSLGRGGGGGGGGGIPRSGPDEIQDDENDDFPVPDDEFPVPQPVPEPTTIVLLGLGAASLIRTRRKNK